MGGLVAQNKINKNKIKSLDLMAVFQKSTYSESKLHSVSLSSSFPPENEIENVMIETVFITVTPQL